MRLFYVFYLFIFSIYTDYFLFSWLFLDNYYWRIFQFSISVKIFLEKW